MNDVSQCTDLDLENEVGVCTFLDSFHHLAATAQFQEYFNLFHPEGKFLGTDATENWTTQEFREWARPFFTDVECAWEYTPIPGKRVVSVVKKLSNDESSEAPTYALFDEQIYCVDLKCLTRGSGTMVFEDNRWHLMLYHITFPIPDTLFEGVTKRIVQGKKRIHAAASLKKKEEQAESVAEQLLLELGAEDDSNKTAKQSKSKKRKKKKTKK